MKTALKLAVRALDMFPTVPLVFGTMREERERVGATLRALRELRGHKPDEFAGLIGISRPYLANIEAGRKPLTDVLLARAAKALEVPQVAIRRPRAIDEVA